MGFWIFMMIMNLLIPFMMIGFGKYFMKSAPGSINIVFGYRTSMSMKNQDTWKFAHQYVGKLWWKLGLLILIPTILIHIPFYGKSDDTVGVLCGIICTIQVIVLCLSIIPVENALKKTFHDDGTRKN